MVMPKLFQDRKVLILRLDADDMALLDEEMARTDPPAKRQRLIRELLLEALATREHDRRSPSRSTP